MPSYLVRFDRPVIYQVGHPKAQCRITALPVRAPSAHAAEVHAYRVTQGEAELTVVEVEDFVGPPPDIETAPDPPPIQIDASTVAVG